MAEQKLLIGRSDQKLISFPRIAMQGSDFRSEYVSSVFVRIGTPAVPMPATWTAATATSGLYSIAEAASEGAMRIKLSALATTIIGSHLLIIDSTTGTWVDVKTMATGTVTGNYLQLAAPLPMDIGASSGVYLYRVEYTLSAAQTALAGECSAEWRATASLDGIGVTQWAQSFRLVRRMPFSTLTPAKLVMAYPAIATKKTRSDISYETLITSAWTHEILPLCDSRGIAEEDIVSAEALEPLHASACLLHLLRQREDVDQAYFERILARHEQLKETTFSRSSWYVVPQDEAMVARDSSVKQSPGIRLVR